MERSVPLRRLSEDPGLTKVVVALRLIGCLERFLGKTSSEKGPTQANQRLN